MYGTITSMFNFNEKFNRKVDMDDLSIRKMNAVEQRLYDSLIFFYFVIEKYIKLKIFSTKNFLHLKIDYKND